MLPSSDIDYPKLRWQCRCGCCPICRARLRQNVLVRERARLRRQSRVPTAAAAAVCHCGLCRGCRVRENTRRYRKRVRERLLNPRRPWLESVEAFVRELFRYHSPMERIAAMGEE